ncbi:MAG: DUF1150 family protein [Tateyamaria sp.]|jgi:hypothetical protein|nr:DUF1150 family protein [Tateyamaria sp.]MDB2578494.1 DUF1150 domain-containing protein [Tateyamaria sp.]MDG1181128.1 DUF1150 family protein [Tateyamaria sp.]MDG1334483.1 DUF1150 family protein [Tateyamaria sp.]MDG2055864.1 DUF1150 family protein [Tateyamaria sp.]
MNTPYDLNADVGRMVYVKPISVDALPRNVRDQAAGLKELFAVIDSEGQQLALVADRNMALALAVQNDYAPQPLH